MELMDFAFIIIIIFIAIITREENSHKYQHLMELMEFAFALQRSVDDFNQSLIEFDLILRSVLIMTTTCYEKSFSGLGLTMGTSPRE